ncbi:MAG: M56 family metallopeptidase [bacterium]
MHAIETVNSWSEYWAGFMGYSVIESTIVFGLIGGLWLLLRNRAWVSAQFGYCLFLLVLLKLMVPGQVSIPDLISSLFPQEQVSSGGQVVGIGGWWLWGEGGPGEKTAVAPATPRAAATVEAQPQPVLTFPSFLMLGWAAGVLAFLMRFCWVEWRTRRMFRKTTPLGPNQIPVNVKRLQHIAGVKQPVRWVTGLWVKSPMAYGILRPVIAIPPEMSEEYTSNQIRWILLHELAHIKRADCIVSVFQKILQIIFFFHPVVWWANSTIDQLREFACDDAALSGSEATRKDCGEGFLSVVFQANGLPTLVPAALGMINYKTTIRRRLMRILDNQRRLHSKLSIGAGVFVLAMTLVVLSFTVREAFGQVGQWLKVSDTGPPPCTGRAMAYDSARDKVVLFGGYSYEGLGSLGDTWEWEGTDWIQVATTGPSPRYDHAMVYDSARGKVVLFGGRTSGSWEYHGDTWEWDGANWTQVATTGPSPRDSHAMVYDSARGKIVLFGGTGSDTTSLDDTWEWDGAEWTQVSAEGPSPRYGHRMAYDSVRRRVVLYGGTLSSDFEEGLDDTWEWDGTEWTQIGLSGVNPGKRLYHGMAFDTARAKTVLFGGAEMISHETSILSGDGVWEWDGSVWEKTSASGPGPRATQGMAYDSNKGQIVLFGGGTAGGRSNIVTVADTWVYSAAPSGIFRGLWSRY